MRIRLTLSPLAPFMPIPLALVPLTLLPRIPLTLLPLTLLPLTEQEGEEEHVKTLFGALAQTFLQVFLGAMCVWVCM